jgi:hypothetical protein
MTCNSHKKNLYKILVWKARRKSVFGTLTCRLDKRFQMEMDYEDVN